MIEKVIICHIKGGIFHAVNRFVKTNNKYIKNYYKKKDDLKYWNVNNLCGWTMLQKLHVNNFNWVADICQ